MSRLLLLVAFALAACGDSGTATSGTATSDGAPRDASGTPTSNVSTETQPSPDPRASNPGMSADSLALARARLEDALERYRQLESSGWPTIPDGDLVEVGDSAAAQVEPLRQRLAAEDALGSAAESGAVYDARLAASVARFQARHGLAVDSLLGANTREALNVSAGERVAQIERSLAQWEDMPEIPTGPGARYVMVNVPEFRVRAFEDGREALQMEVVVGAEYDDRTTPTFHETMDHVIFRPYWNVPPGIATDELVPKGPAQLAEEGFEIVGYYDPDAEVREMTAANLRRVANGSLRLRQKGGEENALGLVKYMFPNQYAVYLHDTPADHLFDEATRAYSHGCIRLERPAEFGAWVLGPQGWDESRVSQSMNSGERQRVELEETIPVFVVYLPVWADESGEVHFSRDIYDRLDS